MSDIVKIVVRHHRTTVSCKYQDIRLKIIVYWGLPIGVAPHTEQLGQSLKKQALYPGSHGMVGGRGAMVNINHKNCNNDWKGNEDHDEEEVLSYKRYNL